MSQLVFDEKLSRQLESNYARRDIQLRRLLVHNALGAKTGERILDVGCGPGFYVAELIERVGPAGAVVGVDLSANMLALAARRCEGRPHVAFSRAPATSLPLADASFDAALSVQVLEFVEDVGAALEELRRVLRPGGRLVVWDVDWATMSWHSADSDRMGRVLRAWDAHLSHPSLPRTLGAALRSAGFTSVAAEGHAFTAIEFDPDSYGVSILPGIAQYVAGRDGITQEEAQAWADEQRELGELGRFFFACLQFCFTATR
ncbi:MAG TPA: methyltransferase domain-containing protein [Actinomycetota bacterium]|nr:methyltransferase domain-containing protein [Actinomycetota bacterium]